MAGIDNTVVGRVLEVLSGFERKKIAKDLYLIIPKGMHLKSGKYSSSGTYSNYDRLFKGFSHKDDYNTACWLLTETWRENICNNVDEQFLETLDAKANEQPFPDLVAPGKYSFTSHLYEVLLRYARNHPAPCQAILYTCKDLSIDQMPNFKHQYLRLQAYTEKNDLEAMLSSAAWLMVDSRTKPPMWH